VQAITAPATYLSAITVAAYKRYTLVSLIHQGAVTPFPKYTSSVVQRHVKQPCAAYTELATAYATHSHDQVAACVAKHEAEYVLSSTSPRLALCNIQTLLVGRVWTQDDVSIRGFDKGSPCF